MAAARTWQLPSGSLSIGVEGDDNFVPDLEVVSLARSHFDWLPGNVASGGVCSASSVRPSFACRFFERSAGALCALAPSKDGSLCTLPTLQDDLVVFSYVEKVFGPLVPMDQLFIGGPLRIAGGGAMCCLSCRCRCRWISSAPPPQSCEAAVRFISICKARTLALVGGVADGPS